MRTKSKLSVWFLAVASLLGLGLAANSCQPEGLIDHTEFSLYYPGIGDVGPSSTITNVFPTWHGSKPSEFMIERITLDGNEYTTESFSLNKETGEFRMENTSDMQAGLYGISISCMAGGSRHNFDDIIQVRMMPAVPEGIKTDPSELSVQLKDIMDIGASLPSANIITEGDHISITSYSIANVWKDEARVENYDDFFMLDSRTGKFMIKHNDSIEPGKYVFDFKLTTTIVDKESEEGVYANALTVIIESAPLALVYSPAQGLVESGYSFASSTPELTGSDNGIKYSIKSVEPACDAILIDETTGVLKVEEGNTLEVGDKYKINVTAENSFGKAQFEECIFNLEVVTFIVPVSKVVYNDVENIQACSISNDVVEHVGDNIRYDFKDLPESLKELQIDHSTGTVTAPRKNSFPLGEHVITVTATNSKNEDQPFETTFKIKVNPNPNMFHYVSWGNNIGLELNSKTASQFRLWPSADAGKNMDNEIVSQGIQDTDMTDEQKDKAIFSLDLTSVKDMEISMDAKGNISAKYHKARKVNFVTVTVTVGEGESQIERKFPVFFDNMFGEYEIKNKNEREKINLDHDVAYSPFGLCINPKTGGKSEAPKVYERGTKDPVDMSNVKEINVSRLAINYKRNQGFWNYYGPASHIDGDPKIAGSLMQQLWHQYDEGVGTGARAPMSYYENEADLSKPLAYFDLGNKCILNVNPNKFVTSDGAANGVFVGQAPFIISASDTDKPGEVDDDINKIFPVGIWFDTQF